MNPQRERDDRLRRFRIARLLAAGFLLAFAGCAGYQLGHRSLFRPDIQTIHVPVFQSDSLRRSLGERLTEAVVREIHLRTPYRVVTSAEADSVLVGNILYDTKRVLAETPNDDARNLAAEMTVEARWMNRNGDLLMHRAGILFGCCDLSVQQSSSFVPEAGQSVATAQQQAIERVAREIVGQLELAW